MSIIIKCLNAGLSARNLQVEYLMQVNIFCLSITNFTILSSLLSSFSFSFAFLIISLEIILSSELPTVGFSEFSVEGLS